MNPYEPYVRQIARLVRGGRELPLGGFGSPSRPEIPEGAPRVLIFSPHPDDEVIIGGLALRLLRELRWNVLNVAVTQGSNRARRQARWVELQRCCEHVGFGLVPTIPGGLEGVNTKTRAEKPGQWAQAVDCIRGILERQVPRVILFPHDDDWNGTHIGSHHLVVDALKAMGTSWSCYTVETEFWGAMDTPNLLVESSEGDVMDLIAALSFHEGEVRRNPYHLRLPAWMIDNVRRGGELVGGQGGAAPDFLFGTLYRLRRWEGGAFRDVAARRRFVGAADDLSGLFS